MMRRYRKMIFLGAALAAAALFSGPVLFAEEDTAVLNQRIKELESRVMELEQQLTDRPSMNESGMTGAPRQGVWDPFAEMEQMQREMNRMFDDRFWRGAGRQGGFPEPATLFDPQVDIEEAEDHYLVRMDIPGMDKSKIDVRIEKNVLKVSGQRESEREQSTPDKYFRRERSFGAFSRNVSLPPDIQGGSVEAEYKDGVLKVKVGRIQAKQEQKEKKIEIK